jgi:hypothetical protein
MMECNHFSPSSWSVSMPVTTAAKAAKALGIHPLFLVPDVVQTAEYYRDVLGFQILNYYGDPPCFVFVRRDRVDIMLKLAQSADQVQTNGRHGVWDAYLWVDDWEAIREELRQRKANIVGETPQTSYATKELDVEDATAFAYASLRTRRAILEKTKKEVISISAAYDLLVSVSL